LENCGCRPFPAPPTLSEPRTRFALRRKADVLW
jgi:hypothetical protein